MGHQADSPLLDGRCPRSVSFQCSQFGISVLCCLGWDRARDQGCHFAVLVYCLPGTDLGESTDWKVNKTSWFVSSWRPDSLGTVGTLTPRQEEHQEQ
jgi:hypothetical protein